MDFLHVGIGLIILLVGGDLLVRGAVALSVKLGVPALIVSLTVVAFGTSAPELLVSVDAALQGAPGLAFGNVIGSNIANILLVLGVPALLTSIDGRGIDTRSSYLQMLGATAIFIALLFLGPLYIWHGAVLLSLLGLMIWRAIRQARASRAAAEDIDFDPEAAATMRGWKIAVYLVLGLIGLPLGADLLVQGARSIALDFGVSDEVIGLTLVAIGTSLPELATTVIAALRNQAAVALGNAIGSNIMNILAIIGITSFFGPLPIDPHLLRVDIWVMAGASLALAPFVLKSRVITRPVGAVALVAYATYIVTLF